MVSVVEQEQMDDVNEETITIDKVDTVGTTGTGKK
jgi:hypothetical protein